MNPTNASVLMCVASAIVPVLAHGQVVIVSSEVVANSTALSGRAGSLEGPVEDHLGPIGGTAGAIGLASIAEAGPVLPGSPPSPSLPGTTGIVTNRSHGGVVFSQVGGTHYIRAYSSTRTEMRFLDGGTHQGYGDAGFRVTFTLSASTPFALSGRFEPDDQDSLALVRLDGSGYLFFGPRGPYSTSGVLGPGTYTLSSGVTVYEVSAGPTFVEQGLITASLVLGSSSQSCSADLGQQGGLPGQDGLLDNNDFIAFIDYFFELNPLADFGSQGGVSGPDGLFDNNDFIVFIDAFFDGCS